MRAEKPARTKASGTSGLTLQAQRTASNKHAFCHCEGAALISPFPTNASFVARNLLEGKARRGPSRRLLRPLSGLDCEDVGRPAPSQ
jgi:hypothetical protein